MVRIDKMSKILVWCEPLVSQYHHYGCCTVGGLRLSILPLSDTIVNLSKWAQWWVVAAVTHFTILDTNVAKTNFSDNRGDESFQNDNFMVLVVCRVQTLFLETFLWCVCVCCKHYLREFIDSSHKKQLILAIANHVNI